VDLLLKDLAGQFNYIVIDSAPVLATDDAACLGPFTDGVYMVVRAAHTSSRMAAEALDRLSRRNVRILGMIYNRAPASTDYYCHYTRDYHGASGQSGPWRLPLRQSPYKRQEAKKMERDQSLRLASMVTVKVPAGIGLGSWGCNPAPSTHGREGVHK